MTKDIYVTIKGLQFQTDAESEGADTVEVINVGQFSEIKGTIYIKYEDMVEGENTVSKNLIKISKDSVEITKKGPVTAHMVFIPNEKTMTYYDTPYGSLYLGIFSRDVQIEKNVDSITITIEYSLEMNYQEISDCKVEILVTPQDTDIKLLDEN